MILDKKLRRLKEEDSLTWAAVAEAYKTADINRYAVS